MVKKIDEKTIIGCLFHFSKALRSGNIASTN